MAGNQEMSMGFRVTGHVTVTLSNRYPTRLGQGFYPDLFVRGPPGRLPATGSESNRDGRVQNGLIVVEDQRRSLPSFSRHEKRPCPLPLSPILRAEGVGVRHFSGIDVHALFPEDHGLLSHFDIRGALAGLDDDAQGLDASADRRKGRKGR